MDEQEIFQCYKLDRRAVPHLKGEGVSQEFLFIEEILQKGSGQISLPRPSVCSHVCKAQAGRSSGKSVTQLSLLLVGYTSVLMSSRCEEPF